MSPKKEIDQLYQDHDWTFEDYDDDLLDLEDYDERDWYLPEDEDEDDYDDEDY